jgi:hypothetical protein
MFVSTLNVSSFLILCIAFQFQPLVCCVSSCRSLGRRCFGCICVSYRSSEWLIFEMNTIRYLYLPRNDVSELGPRKRGRRGQTELEMIDDDLIFESVYFRHHNNVQVFFVPPGQRFKTCWETKFSEKFWKTTFSGMSTVNTVDFMKPTVPETSNFCFTSV